MTDETKKAISIAMPAALAVVGAVLAAVIAFAPAPWAARAEAADAAALAPAAIATSASDVREMHRLYNPNSGEHFYTSNVAERDHLVDVGWSYEGVGWTAPSSSDTPVYRLYNPNAGDHHYTVSEAERDHLVDVGWSYEGVGWYSDNQEGTPLYRQYNPNATAGSHNYTTSKDENDHLVRVGWNEEGIGWYGTSFWTTGFWKNKVKKEAHVCRFGGIRGLTAWYDYDDPDTLHYPVMPYDEHGNYYSDVYDPKMDYAVYIDGSTSTIALPAAAKTSRWTAPATGETIIGRDWIFVLGCASVRGRIGLINALSGDNPEYTRAEIEAQVDAIWPDLQSIVDKKNEPGHGCSNWSDQELVVFTEKS